MKFTDLFIKRPVLATVVSLLVLVLGLRSMSLLPARQYPVTQTAVINVSTTYFGADPSLVAGFITTPLETAIAQTNGIDYLTSTSLLGVSSIQAYLRLNYDADKALTELSAKVNSVLNQLPRESQQPVITLQTGETVDSMYIGFYSEVLPTNKITDYLIRVVQPKLQTVPGVQTAEILGQRQFALRAWLDPDKMAAHNVTSTEVSNALAANDFISAVGRTKGLMVASELTAATGLHSVEEFKSLVIKSSGGAVVRLSDVANVTLGADNYDTAVSFDGKSAVFIGIQVSPAANLLSVAAGVRKVFPSVQQELPVGLSGRIVYDATKYVNNAVSEVVLDADQSAYHSNACYFLYSRHSAFGHHTYHSHTTFAGRGILHNAFAGLLHKPAYPALIGSRHRTCCGRRYYSCREHPAPHRKRCAAYAGSP